MPVHSAGSLALISLWHHEERRGILAAGPVRPEPPEMGETIHFQVEIISSNKKAEKCPWESNSGLNSFGMNLKELQNFPGIYASWNRTWGFVSKIPELNHSYFLSFLYTSECFRKEGRPGVHMVPQVRNPRLGWPLHATSPSMSWIKSRYFFVPRYLSL